MGVPLDNNFFTIVYEPDDIRQNLIKSFVGWFTYDREFKFVVDINRSACANTGYSRDEILNDSRLLRRLFQNSSFNEFEKKIVASAVLYGYSPPINFIITKKDGVFAYVKIQGFSVRDAATGKIYIHCHFVDFTEYTHMMIYLDAIQNGKTSYLKENSERRLFEKSLSGYNLTPIELKICWMVRNGLGTRTIARKLKISKTTVFTHRKNIRHKLGLTSQKRSLIEYLIEFT